MTAFELIAHDLPALKVEQTGRDAFHLLNDHHVKHLPVLEGNQLVGIISEEDIFTHKLYEPVSEYDFSMLRSFSVRADEHIFEVIRVMGEHRLTVVPVADAEGKYLGAISQNTLLRAFSGSTTFSMPGGVIIFELNRRDYSLAAIARIVEEESAQILTSMVTSAPDAELLEVTIKINRDDATRIIAALERRGFHIKHTFANDAYGDTLKERYDSLMNYLSI